MRSSTRFQSQRSLAISEVAKERETSAVRYMLTLRMKFINVSVTIECCYITADYNLFTFDKVNIHVVPCSDLTSNLVNNKLII